jgi:hypothetical protein
MVWCLVQRTGRLEFARFATAALAAMASLVPFVLYTSHQVGQVN